MDIYVFYMAMWKGCAIDRDEQKNKLLLEKRWVSFTDVVYAIDHKHILSVTSHHNQKKYAHQIKIVFHKWWYPYVCAAELLLKKKHMTLITIFPNRKYKHLLS
jgi:uncharacterized DUF497 family protein